MAEHNKHFDDIRESYVSGSFAVTDALRAWLEGNTEPPSIADLLEFCRVIERKAKELTQEASR